MNERRLEAVRKKIHSLRLDALVVTSVPNIRYLSGFSGSTGVCVIFESDQAFVSDGRYKTQATEEISGFRLLTARRGLFEEMKQKKLLPSGGRIGFESQYLTVAGLDNLKSLFPKVKLVPTSLIVETIASVKEQLEINTIKKAVSITDRVFRKLLDIIRAGIRELDVAAEISYLQKSLGGEAEAFDPIVASGERGALPHARASAKKICDGDLVVLDFGCRYEGYHSDLTRTVIVGSASAEKRKMHETVLKAQQEAIDRARSGLKARALDSIARSVIRKAGYGRFFNHSLGHGLGLQVHEMPKVSSLSNDVFRVGNVFTIEPGVYVPGVGGVRIEDDVVIREGYCEVLNQAPKEMIHI